MGQPLKFLVIDTSEIFLRCLLEVAGYCEQITLATWYVDDKGDCYDVKNGLCAVEPTEADLGDFVGFFLDEETGHLNVALRKETLVTRGAQDHFFTTSSDGHAAAGETTLPKHMAIPMLLQFNERAATAKVDAIFAR